MDQTSAKGHVWTAPSWQGLSSCTQHWSVQPCVRPVDAVHITAGHNALRGSGPGQKLAFDNALAKMGCPDRRIDRLCITCCSPFPTVNDHLTIRVNAMNLKDRLRDIETDSRNRLHDMAPPNHECPNSTHIDGACRAGGGA